MLTDCNLNGFSIGAGHAVASSNMLCVLDLDDPIIARAIKERDLSLLDAMSWILNNLEDVKAKLVREFEESEEIWENAITAHKKERSGYIYLVKATTDEYKIGRTIDVEKRLNAFSVQPPFEYELIHHFPVTDMVSVEADLHKKYATKRIIGEWFRLSEEDVQAICSMAGEEA